MTVFNLALVQRRLFAHLADQMRLYRVPPLADHIELSLLAVLLARCLDMISAEYMRTLLLILFPTHILRSLRWQLSLLYITCFIYVMYHLHDNLFLLLPILVTLFVCLLIPVVPPIIHSNPEKSIGVQDICLRSETGKRFWSKFYYPCKYRHTLDPLTLTSSLCPFLLIAYLSHHGMLEQMRASQYHTIMSLTIFTVHTCCTMIEICLGLSVSKCFPSVKYGYGLARYQRMPGLIFSHLRLMTMHCIEDGEVEDVACLQVVLYFHGLSGVGSSYSQTCMELASKGYLVIAPEFSDGSASYTALPDGEEINYRFHDDFPEHTPGWYESFQSQLVERAHQVNALMNYLPQANKGSISAYYHPNLRFQRSKRSFFLDSIQGKISTEKPILLGHSFGGATCVFLSSMEHKAAVKFRQNYGFRTMILYDPWLQPMAMEVRSKALVPIEVPVLCLQAERWIESNNEAELDCLVVKESPLGYIIKVRGAGHTNFADGGMFSPVIGSRLGASGTADPTILLDAITRVTAEFLATHADLSELELQNTHEKDALLCRDRFLAAVENAKSLFQTVSTPDTCIDMEDDRTTDEA